MENKRLALDIKIIATPEHIKIKVATPIDVTITQTSETTPEFITTGRTSGCLPFHAYILGTTVKTLR